MKTIKADAYQRVRLPDIKPGQVMAYAEGADGCITLTPVKAEGQERFPPGSLKRFVTKESNRELLEMLKGCTLEVPE